MMQSTLTLSPFANKTPGEHVGLMPAVNLRTINTPQPPKNEATA